MSRIKADLLLVLTAIIWGGAFVCQKTAMDSIGPFAFIAARFWLSAFVVFPLACRELSRRDKSTVSQNFRSIFVLGAVFVLGVTLQQLGVGYTTVTNAGFLTGLYAIFTPFFAWVIFRQRPMVIIWISAVFSVAGVWLLGGAASLSFNPGDLLVIGCACFFALHTLLISHVVRRLRTPLFIAFCQYTICAVISLLIALSTETVTLSGLWMAGPAILYAGLLSGGVAYTLQIVAQQYTLPSDAGIILSSESLFAALAGVFYMGDTLSPVSWAGCGVIALSILLIELAPILASWRQAGR